MNRYRYSVTPFSPIKELIPGKSIRTPFTADLDKDEVFLCMKHGPVYRLFPGKDPIKVTGSNFESLHVRLFEDVKETEPVKVEEKKEVIEETPVTETVVEEPLPNTIEEEEEPVTVSNTEEVRDEVVLESSDNEEVEEETSEDYNEEESNEEVENTEAVGVPTHKYNPQYKPNYSKKKNRNKNHNN